ncbi:hypothetical protein CK556_02395 [Mesoplasma chauliocola]|uniref:Uncharacterized protein n=2 Tax=Mesoplasma chauliocola TaxID=216427 RepID=A0A249SNF0_9MOLU|nr:hypothetical protein CK556_02395 [Mesoplasma chauliocola]
MEAFLIIFFIVIGIGLTYYGAELCFKGNSWGFLAGFVGSAIIGIIICFVMYEKGKNNNSQDETQVVKTQKEETHSSNFVSIQNIEYALLKELKNELEKLNAKLSFQNTKLKLKNQLINEQTSTENADNESLKNEIKQLKEEIKITKIEIKTCKNKINFLEGEE